jgi:DNA-3-methyladenine glycosylase I
MIAYHDTEWGVVVRDGQVLFGKLMLDGFQAGLSWLTILRKREAFLKAFDGWDPERMARYSRRRIESLLRNPGIIRNRQKVESAVSNAKAYLRLVEREGDFGGWLWQFTGGEPIVNRWRRLSQLPCESPQSHEMSKALRAEGFRFCGPTICYAFMQAVGMVNDHLITCHRHAELSGEKR